MISEKIRAAFQRSKVRDLYDLNRFAALPFDCDLLRGLVVLKLWQSKDPFDPNVLFTKIRSAEYDWEDLNRLVRPGERHMAEEVISQIQNRYSKLNELTNLEQQVVAGSKSGRDRAIAKKLQNLLAEWNGERG